MQEADILRISLSLVLIVGLIFASAWVAKRGGLLRHKSAQRIQILSSQRVGPRANLMLVQIGKQQLLIGVTPQQINTLHALTEADLIHHSDPDEISARRESSPNPLNAMPETEQPSSARPSFKRFLQRSQSTQHNGSR